MKNQVKETRFLIFFLKKMKNWVKETQFLVFFLKKRKNRARLRKFFVKKKMQKLASENVLNVPSARYYKFLQKNAKINVKKRFKCFRRKKRQIFAKNLCWEIFKMFLT